MHSRIPIQPAKLVPFPFVVFFFFWWSTSLMKPTEKHNNLFFMLTSSAHYYAQQDRLQHYWSVGIKITPFSLGLLTLTKKNGMQTTDKGHNFVQIIGNWIYSHYSLLGAHIGLLLIENVFTESFPQLESLFSIVTIWSLRLGYKDRFVCFVGDTILN